MGRLYMCLHSAYVLAVLFFHSKLSCHASLYVYSQDRQTSKLSLITSNGILRIYYDVENVSGSRCNYGKKDASNEPLPPTHKC